MKFKLQNLACLCLSTLLGACGTSKMDSAPPTPKAWLKAPPNTPSTLVIPLELKLADLGAEFDRRFPSVIAQQSGLNLNNCPTSECKADFKVIRKGNLQLSPNPDGSINITLPVRIEGQIGFSQSLGFTTVAKSQAFAGEMVMSLASRMSINPDWSLKSSTYMKANFSQAVLPIQIPMVGTVNFNIQPILEPLVRKVLEKQGPEIDKMIAQRFSLKPMAQDLWQKAQVGQSFDLLGQKAFLNLNPSEVYFQNIKIENGLLKTALGLKGNLMLNLGNAPQNSAVSPLPGLKVSEQLRSQLQIQLPMRLPYTELSKLLNQQLAGKEFETDGRKVLLKNMDVSGLGEQLLIKIQFKSSSPQAEGSAYVLGTPKFDAQNQILTLEQVKLSTESNSMLLNTAAWLAHGFFESKIQSMAKYDLKQQFSDLQNSANQLLQNYQIPEISNLIQLRGQIQSMGLQSVIPEPMGLQILMNAQGSLSAQSASKIR